MACHKTHLLILFIELVAVGSQMFLLCVKETLLMRPLTLTDPNPKTGGNLCVYCWASQLGCASCSSDAKLIANQH